MSSNPAIRMEVDNPAILKRSSSAPMINELSTTMTSSTSTVTTARLVKRILHLTYYNSFCSLEYDVL